MDDKSVTGIMAAIGQPTRLAILRAVAPHSRGEDAQGMAAGDIARLLDVPPATLSFHLKNMTYKGLLNPQRDGRSIRYRANLDALVKALDYLVREVCGV